MTFDEAHDHEAEIPDGLSVGQIPGESAKAFAAWLLYREMSPALRSIRQVALKLGKSGALVARWSSKHRWQERVTVWDQRAALMRAAEGLEAARRVAREQLEVGDELVALGRAALRTVEPNAITAATAVRLIALGSRLARVGAGLEDPSPTVRVGREFSNFVTDLALPYVAEESVPAFLQAMADAGNVAGSTR